MATGYGNCAVSYERFRKYTYLLLDIYEFMTRTHYVYLCIRTAVRIICVCVCACVLACEDVWTQAGRCTSSVV